MQRAGDLDGNRAVEPYKGRLFRAITVRIMESVDLMPR